MYHYGFSVSRVIDFFQECLCSNILFAHNYCFWKLKSIMILWNSIFPQYYTLLIISSIQHFILSKLLYRFSSASSSYSNLQPLRPGKGAMVTNWVNYNRHITLPYRFTEFQCLEIDLWLSYFVWFKIKKNEFRMFIVCEPRKLNRQIICQTKFFMAIRSMHHNFAQQFFFIA